MWRGAEPTPAWPPRHRAGGYVAGWPGYVASRSHFPTLRAQGPPTGVAGQGRPTTPPGSAARVRRLADPGRRPRPTPADPGPKGPPNLADPGGQGRPSGGPWPSDGGRRLS